MVGDHGLTLQSVFVIVVVICNRQQEEQVLKRSIIFTRERANAQSSIFTTQLQDLADGSPTLAKQIVTKALPFCDLE